MTRGDAKEALAKLGGRRGTIIGAGVGCGSVVIGLLLACGLLFGWVGNTVSGAIESNQQAAEYTVADEWGKAPGAYDSRNEAAGMCGPGQEATGTVYGDGSWAGWQCVEVRR